MQLLMDKEMLIKKQAEEIKKMKMILEVTVDEPFDKKASQVSLRRQPRISRGSVRPVVRHLIGRNKIDIANNNNKINSDELNKNNNDEDAKDLKADAINNNATVEGSNSTDKDSGYGSFREVLEDSDKNSEYKLEQQKAKDNKVLRYKKRERRKTMAVQLSDLNQISS